MRIQVYCWLFLLFGLPVSAQKIKSLEFLGAYEIPYGYRYEGTVVGGLSGITYLDGYYYVVADKPPARFYQMTILFTDTLDVKIEAVKLLRPDSVSDSELESIIPTPDGSGFFLSDEQKEGTRVLMVNKEGEIQQMVLPEKDIFIPLSNHNSGIEGIALSEKGNCLYYAFERPTLDCSNLGLVSIKRIKLATGYEASCYYYELHDPPVDPLGTNGISEIISINRTDLMIMERAYIPGQGNVVKLFSSNVPPERHYCDDDNFTLKSELMFDFSSVPGFKIDNAEGMCLNEDGSILYIVTDNNFNKTQHTQIVALGVNYY